MINQMNEANQTIDNLYWKMANGDLTATATLGDITVIATLDETPYGNLINWTMTDFYEFFSTRNAKLAVNKLFNAISY